MPRPPSGDARSKMLRAAAAVAVDVGIARFSIDEVARRSGVAKTTIYRHFPDTTLLLVAALDQALHAPDAPDTGSLRGDLLEYLRSVRPHFADRKVRALWFELFVAGERDPALRRHTTEVLGARAVPMATIHEHARARGELAPGVDLATMFDVVQGPLVLRSLLRPETLPTLDLDELADRMVAALTSA